MVADKVKGFLMALPIVAFIVGACNSNGARATASGAVATHAKGQIAMSGHEIEQGVWRSEVTLPVAGDAPRAWVYEPTAALAPHPKTRFPCVFIAPAGTDVTGGAPLNDEERETHIPYVKAGMIVVAYEINGLSGDKAEAARDFQTAQTGLVNAQGAVTWALKNVPGIDASRLFAVGHSSAGTLALQLAQHDKRIRAGVGYAPACNFAWPDPGGSVLDIAAREDDQVPGFSNYLRSMMPQNNIAHIRCPLFLFSCDDDTTVNPHEVQEFVAAAQKQGKPVHLQRRPEGGHVDGMKEYGIPAAIHWLNNIKSDMKSQPTK